MLSVAFAPAVAEACAPGRSEAIAEVPGVLYVAGSRLCCSEFDSIWVYQESNGLAGLQRDDEFVDDTCGGVFEADHLVI